MSVKFLLYKMFGFFFLTQFPFIATQWFSHSLLNLYRFSVGVERKEKVNFEKSS